MNSEGDKISKTNVAHDWFSTHYNIQKPDKYIQYGTDKLSPSF